jgi:hypothetical protein
MAICVANYCQKLALTFLHSPFISVNTAELFAKTDISHFSCAMTMCQISNHHLTICQKTQGVHFLCIGACSGGTELFIASAACHLPSTYKQRCHPVTIQSTSVPLDDIPEQHKCTP